MKKNLYFKKIRVLIWDFDGTLYKPNPSLFQAVREAEYRTIMDHIGWDLKKTEAEFKKLYKVVYPSATKVVAVLSGISVVQAATRMEQYFDRRNYLVADLKLVELFNKLKRFRHFTLANGVKAKHTETLKALGVDPGIFEEMVTSEIVGVNKPDPDGFLYILKKTGLSPQAHLMIGDRPKVDLEPAKKLGMKTCLVWSDTPSEVADVTIKSVYMVGDLIKNS